MMKKIVAIMATLLGLVLAGLANAEIAGLVRAGTRACVAEDFSAESKALLNRWIELNDKLEAGTLTQAEYEEGSTLELTQICGFVDGARSGVVLLSDGLDYWVELYDGIRLVLKADGFIRNE